LGATEEPDDLHFVILSFKSWFATIIQLLITFLMTQFAALVKSINSIIAKIETDINDILDKKIRPTFDTIFTDGFGIIRNKMLEMIKKIEKIEGPLEKAESMGGINLSKGFSGLGGSLKSSAADGAKQKADEAAKKAAESAKKSQESAKKAAEDSKKMLESVSSSGKSIKGKIRSSFRF